MNLLENSRNFEPTRHICKFGFELFDHATNNPLRYNILSDLYLKELTFEFISKRTEEIKEVVGFKLSKSAINSLLPIVEWEKFEEYRDLPSGWEWDIANGNRGYRDGWGYKFWCLSECGNPLFQIYMDCVFDKEKLPPYEKLLGWVRTNYKHKKQLKGREMLW